MGASVFGSTKQKRNSRKNFFWLSDNVTLIYFSQTCNSAGALCEWIMPLDNDFSIEVT